MIDKMVLKVASSLSLLKTQKRVLNDCSEIILVHFWRAERRAAFALGIRWVSAVGLFCPAVGLVEGFMFIAIERTRALGWVLF